jgi:hypothetical protein
MEPRSERRALDEEPTGKRALKSESTVQVQLFAPHWVFLAGVFVRDRVRRQHWA